MSLLAGPVFALAVLAAWAGVVKLADPRPTARAMRSIGLPGGEAGARVVGLGEIAVAALALSIGSRASAGLLAAMYLAFTLVALRLARRGAEPCGCFGETEVPTGPRHVALNAAATAVCAAAVVAPTGGLLDVLAGQPLAGVPFLVLTGLAAWLWYVVLEVLPDVQGQPARGSSGSAGGSSGAEIRSAGTAP